MADPFLTNQQLVAGWPPAAIAVPLVQFPASHPTHRVMAAPTATLNAAPLPNAPNQPPQRISDFSDLSLLFSGFCRVMLLMVGVNSVSAVFAEIRIIIQTSRVHMWLTPSGSALVD